MSLVATDLRRDIPLPDGSVRPVFAGVNLSVAPGEVVCVVGPSGCGKSTLLRCLAGLDELSHGTVSLGEDTPASLGLPVWRTRCAYVSQARWAFPGSPADTWAELTSLGAQKARAQAHGDPVATCTSVGLQSDSFTSSWATLSGGQAQRAALAIVLALNPPLLLLDEPTSACDPASTALVEAALLRSGASLVWVTHDAAQPLRVGATTVSLPASTPAAVTVAVP